MQTRNKYIYLLVIVLLLAGCSSEVTEQNEQAISEEEEMNATLAQLNKGQQELAGIETGTIQRRTISGYIQCTGAVEVPPSNLISVHAPTAGFAGKVSQLVGDYVKKGSLLTTLKHPDLIRLQGQYLESLAKQEVLQKDYDRKLRLSAQDAASEQVVEQAKAELTMEQAHLKGLTAELEFMGVSTEKLQQEGTVQQQVYLRAPGSGYINTVNVNPGKLVSSEDMLYQILDVSHQHLELKVFGKDINSVKEGQRIEVQIPGTSRTVEGEVFRLGKMIDLETKTATVHGHFLKEPTDLLPGTYVQGRIHIAEAEVLALPETAIVREGDNAFVFVQQGDGFVKTPVLLGRQDGGYFEMLDWKLAESTKIALKGAYYLNGSM